MGLLRSQKRKPKKSKRRVVLALVLFTVSLIGIASWRLVGNNDAKLAPKSGPKITCISEDKVICRFITKWTPSTEYRTVIKDDSTGTTTTYEYELNDHDKIHTTVEGAKSYEVITIDNTIYTKAGETWWKRIIETEAVTKKQKSSSRSQEFEPLKPTQYKRLEKESCEDLQCYKYQVNDPDNPEVKQFIWFDDKEYRLRKMAFKSGDSTVEQTFEYVDVAISKPSPVRELAPNQQLTPGDPAPTDI